jgi:ketosteroid isomerase-like protein
MQPPLSSPKGQEMVAAQQVKWKEVGPSLEEELFQDKPLEQQPSKKASDHAEKRVSSAKEHKRDYRRLFLEVGGMAVMALAGGYLLWSVFSPSTAKSPEPKGLSSKDTVSQILPSSSSSANPAPTVTDSRGFRSGEESSAIPKEAPPSPLPLPDTSRTPSAEIREIGNIKIVLENIRRANLQEDIDLFLHCYASDFRNREEKRKATLANWKMFNYHDLSYDLKKTSISDNTAKARVEWVIKISSKEGGRRQENRSILDVTFKKEEGRWKIEEVKQAR